MNHQRNKIPKTQKTISGCHPQLPVGEQTGGLSQDGHHLIGWQAANHPERREDKRKDWTETKKAQYPDQSPSDGVVSVLTDFSVPSIVSAGFFHHISSLRRSR